MSKYKPKIIPQEGFEENYYVKIPLFMVTSGVKY